MRDRSLLLLLGVASISAFLGAQSNYPVPGTTIPSGLVTFVTSGSCPTGWAEASELSGVTLVGTTKAKGDVGTTGGNDNLTPSGTVSAPSLTMDSYTPGGTNSTSTISWPMNPPVFSGNSGTVSAATISWPAGVPTFAGNAISSILNHTHTISITDPGHTHTIQAQGSTTASTSGTNIMTSTATGGSSRTMGGVNAANSKATGITASSANPAGGVASITPSGTISWPAGVPTNSTTSFTPVGTVAWPMNVPTNSNPVFSGNSATLTGSISTPAFTGNVADNRSAFVKAIFCRKS